MGPLASIDSTTTRTVPVAAVRGVAAVAADTGGKRGGSETVNVSARAAETAARADRAERRARETGDPEIDRTVAANGAPVRTVTYSFQDKAVPAGNVESQQARNAVERQRVIEALHYYASVADVRFVEVGAGGELQYAVTPQPSAAELSAARAEAEAKAEAAQAKADTAAAEARAVGAEADAQAAAEDGRARSDELVAPAPAPGDGTRATPA